HSPQAVKQQVPAYAGQINPFTPPEACGFSPWASGAFFVFCEKEGYFCFDSCTAKSMVGVSAASAHRWVGCPFGARTLQRRDEPRGAAGEALRSHEQSLCHPLDGVFRPVPAVLYHGVWGRGADGALQPEGPPPWCGTRLRPMGR